MCCWHTTVFRETLHQGQGCVWCFKETESDLLENVIEFSFANAQVLHQVSRNSARKTLCDIANKQTNGQMVMITNKPHRPHDLLGGLKGLKLSIQISFWKKNQLTWVFSVHQDQTCTDVHRRAQARYRNLKLFPHLFKLPLMLEVHDNRLHLVFNQAEGNEIRN